MISLFFLLYFATQDNVHCLTATQVVDSVRRIHELDWTDVTESDVRKLVPIALKREVAEIPAGSVYRQDCSGAIYLSHELQACAIVILFSERDASNGKCKLALDSVRVELEMKPADAEANRLAIITALGATGAVREDFSEYQWRSDDSRTRYILETGVTKTGDVNSERMEVRLLHKAVSPATVDHLPFRKGYFPPVCQR